MTEHAVMDTCLRCGRQVRQSAQCGCASTIREWDARCLTPDEVKELVAGAERVMLSDAECEWLDEEFGDAFTVRWCNAINRILLSRVANDSTEQKPSQGERWP